MTHDVEPARGMDVGVCRACESVQPIERIDQGDGLCPDCQRCRDFGNCPRCAYAEGSGVACDWCKPPPPEPEDPSSSALIGAETRGFPTDHARCHADKARERAERDAYRAELDTVRRLRDSLLAERDSAIASADRIADTLSDNCAENERLREALREIENRLASGRAYAEIVNVWVLVDRVEAIAREATA